jgi:uncharacterized protein (TIGR03437 family)
MRIALLPALVPAGALAQKPVINPNGVVNAASYVQSPWNGHALAPGSIAAIFGQNLAAATRRAGTTPLPTTLAGASVTVNGVAAPLFYVSPTQINFQVPSDVPQGTATGYSSVAVAVTTAAGSSDAEMVDTYYSGPGIFTLDGSGCGQGAVLNVKADGSVSVNGPGNSASPGDYLEIFGTGGGSPRRPIPDGAPAPMDTSEFSQFSGGVLLDGIPLDGYRGKAPGMVGVDQINVQVPANVREGCAVPVWEGGPSDFATPPVLISIHSGGGQCVDPPLATLGRISLSRVSVLNANPPTQTDTFTASFEGSPGATLPQPPAQLQEGYTSLAQTTGQSPACPLPGYVSLDAGTISLAGPAASPTTVAASLVDGKIVYQETLPAGMLQGGTLTVSADGGTNVGPFQTSMAVGAPIQITSEFPAGTYVDLSQPFVVTWQGGDPNSVVTVRLIAHYFLYDSFLKAQAYASVGSITMQPMPNPVNGQILYTLPIVPSSNVEVIVDVSPDPTKPLMFASPGLTLGGFLNWDYEYDFPGLTMVRQ